MFLTNGKKVFLVILCVLLLAGGFFAFNMKRENPNAVPESKTEMIFSISDEEITTIDVKNSDGKFSLERIRRTITSWDGRRYEDFIYGVYGNEDILLSQSKLKKLLSDFYEFHVLETVSQKSDDEALKKYGFTEEESLIHINTKGDVTHTFWLGGVSPDGEARYVRKSGDEKIYKMNRLKEEAFLNNLDFYREKRLETIDTSTVLSISITDKGERKMGIRFRNENDEEVVTTENTTYVMILPFSGMAKTEKFNALVSSFYQVYAEDFIEDNAADLTKYGLNPENAIRVVIQDIDRNVHRLTFGNADEKGNIYTLYNNEKIVFTTLPEMYNAVKNLNPSEYIDIYANLYGMDDVKNVTVTSTEKTYSLDINENSRTKYEINDKEANERGFELIYEGIITIMITGQAEEERKEKEILDITFTLKDGTKKTAKYYEYDSRNYGVVTTGGTYGLVETGVIDNLLEVIEIFDNKPHLIP